jgi:glyceraldehyde 3-phosphate dehydrogenase
MGGTKEVVINSLLGRLSGINLDAYKPKYSIISSASNTTNCLAPIIVKVFHDKFGIANVSMSTFHVEDITDIKFVTNNLTSKYTEAAEVVGRIVPSLDCRLACVDIYFRSVCFVLNIL